MIQRPHPEMGFDTCAKMEAYFNKGGKYLEDEMLISEDWADTVKFSCDSLEYTEYDTLWF